MPLTHITISLTLTVTIVAAALSQNVATASHHAAPAPAVDCTTVVLNLVDCLSYVSQGSAVKKPEGSCCSGLKTVLKSNPECLCETFKNSAQFGVSLNLTKAMALPQACKLSAPSVANCGASIGGAPAQSPTPLTPSSITGAPTTTEVANDFSPALAPTPGSTTSSAFAVSATMALVLSVVCASFSLF